MENIIALLEAKKYTQAQLKKKLNVVGYIRALLFLGLTFLLYKYFIAESGIKLHLYLAIFLIILFLGLGLLLLNLKQALKLVNNYLHIGNQILNKTEFETGLYADEILDHHPYAKDLDIIGKNSLFSELNYSQTILGKNKLRDYLLHLSLSKEVIENRQKSIQEISTKNDWILQFLALSKNLEITAEIKHPEKVKGVFKNEKLIRIASFLVPICTFFSIILISIFSLPISYAASIFAGILIFAQIITFLYREDFKKISTLLEFNSSQYEEFLALFDLIEKAHFEQKLNVTLQNKLISTKNKSSKKEIEKLARLLRNYENAHSNIGFILNNFFLWKLIFAVKVTRQIKNIEQELPQWFSAFAEFEALISLGIFHYRNPTYVFPSIQISGDKMKCRAIIHPLLHQENVVSNHFKIDAETEISIVTGANMTGKSTFLRTVGVNLVLAMIGCPVATKEFSFIPMNLFTSMRTSDSLNDGTSYFNAEILRLRNLVENLDSGAPQFIILDEILKGTNSQDKLTGSELFLEKLMKSSTLFSCLIATHDLDLTKIEEKYPEKIKNYCFELQNENGELLTDYKLQTAITKSMNAIYLMKKFGIVD